MDDDWGDPYDYSCHDEGMRGNCGEDCSVFLRGDCDVEDEILTSIGVKCIDDIGVEPEDPGADFDRAMEILK